MRCLSLWMMMDGATGTHTQKKRESDEMTDEMIERDEARREVLSWMRDQYRAAKLTQEIKERKWEDLEEDE